MTPCPESSPECRFYNTKLGCSENVHHTYWPKKEYTTPLEKEFRETHKVPMCMAAHVELHATTPPPAKPDREFMLRAIQGVVNGRR